jgi:signal transduction histidine kinase
MAVPFPSSPIPMLSAPVPVPELKLLSRIWDPRTSKDSISRSSPADTMALGTAEDRLPEAFWKKEREPVGRGQKRTYRRGTFSLMANATWIHGAAGMALGIGAAWLGAPTAAGNGAWVPGMLGAAAVLAGLAWGARANRKPAPLASGFPARSLAGEGAEAEAGGAALLGHEIKNYLCTLKGNASLLRQRVPTDDQAIIDRIDRVVEKLESFTRRMGASEAATGLGVLTPVVPSQTAQACVRTHFHKRSEAFRFHEDPGAPPLLCDPGRLEQVFLNLYANALEAGAVRVDTWVRREENRLLIRIEDDGRGCAREDLARIFEPFFTTKTGPARRGLGMFIVQSIVENHGGRVQVESKNGSGAGRTGLIFTLVFRQGRGAVPGRPAALAATASLTAERMPRPSVPMT